MMADMMQNVFSALADPRRRMLIETLTDQGARTATQLARDLPITRQGVAKHLSILEEAELVTVHQRGRDKFYTLTPEPLEEASTWIAAIAARWDERLERLRSLVEDESEDEDNAESED